ncbi:MAG: hypothetical protein K6U14_08535 [Firmicutes bacterium]|nr:hypothetical protein [Alicyclobacillaceae bacterium]MCL6497655.1 hypothetical protein [Bacillota bacterium]
MRVQWRGLAAVMVAVGVAACLLGGYFVFRHEQTPAATALVIRVGGTPGVRFSGKYQTVNGRGNSQDRAISGVTPATYVAGPGTVVVSVSVRKLQAAGRLVVSVVQGERVLAEETASQPFSGVTAAVRLTGARPPHLRSTDRYSEAP